MKTQYEELHAALTQIGMAKPGAPRQTFIEGVVSL